MMGKLFGTDGVRGEANRYPMNAEMAFAIGQARRNQPSVSSRRKSRWALTPASLIIVARSRLSGVTRSDLTFRRSFAHPLTRQRKRIRNRCWQLLFCRFLRGPRRLDLQPWLPLPRRNQCAPFRIAAYISIFYRDGKICFHAQLPSKSFRLRRQISRLRSILWTTGSERRVSSGLNP